MMDTTRQEASQATGGGPARTARSRRPFSAGQFTARYAIIVVWAAM